jgi:import inner membrane translocase subunit TIM10
VKYLKKTHAACFSSPKQQTIKYGKLYIHNFRMTACCLQKCIPPKYKEAELSKGEAVCLDRCVAKYMEIHDRIGKKLTQLSQEDESRVKQMQAHLQQQS